MSGSTSQRELDAFQDEDPLLSSSISSSSEDTVIDHGEDEDRLYEEAEAARVASMEPEEEERAAREGNDDIQAVGSSKTRATPAAPSRSSLSKGASAIKDAAIFMVRIQFGWKTVFTACQMIIFGIILCGTAVQFVWWHMSSPYIIRGIAYRRVKKLGSKPYKMSPTSAMSSASCSASPIPGATTDDGEQMQNNNSSFAGEETATNVSASSYASYYEDDEGFSDTESVRSETTSFNPSKRGGIKLFGATKRNNRANLDLHFPVHPATVLKAQHNGSSSSDKPGGEKFPVMILVTGGAWVLGTSFWSSLLARIFADNGYLTVCPDYRNFPQATVSEMVEDVTDSIAWTFRSIEKYGGDLSKVTILGQSAGAHLLFQSLVEQAELLAQGRTPTFDPRRAHRVIGLSGLYDLPSLENHFDRLGLYRQIVRRMFEGKESYEHFSPLHRLNRMSLVTFDQYMPRKMMLIHGTADKSAPLSESTKMHDALRKKMQQVDKMRGDGSSTSWRDLDLILLDGATHTTPFVEEPVMMKSEVVRILCEKDEMPEPVFETRPAIAGKKRLAVASKYFMSF